MCVHVWCVCTYMYSECVCGCWRQVAIKYLPQSHSTLLFATQSAWCSWFGSNVWAVRCRDRPVFISPALGIQAYAIMPGFLWSAGDPNPGPHACITFLPTEPQPRIVNSLINTSRGEKDRWLLIFSCKQWNLSGDCTLCALVPKKQPFETCF